MIIDTNIVSLRILIFLIYIVKQVLDWRNKAPAHIGRIRNTYKIQTYETARD